MAVSHLAGPACALMLGCALLTLERGATVAPLDAAGRPGPKGAIVVLGVGMSNAHREFETFQENFEADGTHPGMQGREKVGRLLLEFFRNDLTTLTWFQQ